jgi:hypothetical protein
LIITRVVYHNKKKVINGLFKLKEQRVCGIENSFLLTKKKIFNERPVFEHRFFPSRENVFFFAFISVQKAGNAH